MSNKANKGNFIRDKFLYSPKRWRIAVAVGAIILVVGIVGAIYFGSIDVAQVVKRNVNPQTGLPYSVSGIPPASAQVVSEILIFIGLFVLAYGVATRYTHIGSKMG